VTLHGQVGEERGPIFTVGHGTRTVAELVGMLRAARVTVLVDVRRFPASRRSPHLAREPLAAALAAHGIRYEWQGEELGGRRSRSDLPSRHRGLENRAFQGYAEWMDTPQFRAALDGLVARARPGERIAVMCAETLWWRCHRGLIADALTLAGVSVVHLVNSRAAQPHRLNRAVRLDEEGRPIYDAGVMDEPSVSGRRE
jgi:uncharacterized protein (DUF488 family)